VCVSFRSIACLSDAAVRIDETRDMWNSFSTGIHSVHVEAMKVLPLE
jgi:hypothetical protein